MRRTSLIALYLSSIAGWAFAQTPAFSSEGISAPAKGNEFSAGTGAGKRAWTILPSITLQETFTDNATLGQGSKTADQITELSPGLRLDGSTTRLKMHLDYRLRQLFYAQGSRGSETQNYLNSFGTFEALENLMFVDMTGSINRQNISALGVQSPNYYAGNKNSTETASFRISPYFKGSLLGYADYEVRYSRSVLRAKSANASDSDAQEWQGRLSGNTPLTFLGWTAEASRRSYSYKLGRDTESDMLRGRLTYRVDPQLKLSASIGLERNDFSSLAKQSWTTSGYGADWSPTERTQMSAFREKRFFGAGHNISFSHRFQRSAIKYVDSRDVSSQPNQLATVGMGNIYDLLFSQMSSSIPDPATRATYVNTLLQESGIPANTQVNLGFLASQVMVTRWQELSYVLQGSRNTLTAAFNRSRNERLGVGQGAGDDFSNASAIVQQGISVGLSHQLSPLVAVNVTGTRSLSTGTGVTANVSSESRQKSLSAGLTAKLGARTSAAMTVRRTESDGTVAPYTENAVVGSVSIQF